MGAYAKYISLIWLVVQSVHATIAVTNTPGEYFDTVNNNVARSIVFTITATSTGVNIQIAPQTPNATIITGVPGVADISVKATTVTKTYAQIKKDKGISIPFTLTATPNSSASPAGYQTLFTVLIPLVNVLINSPQFFQMQIPPATLGNTTVLYCNMLYNGQPAPKWVLAPPQGLNFSQTWTTDTILQETKNTASSTTFTLTIPSSSFTNLQKGIYWMNSFVIMSPISTNTTLVPNQVATLAKYIQQGNTLIDGQVNVFATSEAQTAVIKANQAFLAKTIQEIIKENASMATTLENIVKTVETPVQ